jgi:hypothetical protein
VKKQANINHGEKKLRKNGLRENIAKVLLLIVTAVNSRVLIQLAIWRTCWEF